MTERFIDLGTGLATRIMLAFGEEEGRLTVELSGGAAAPLLTERGALTVAPSELATDEAALLAPLLAAHPRAGIVRFRRDDFGAYELAPAVASPFRFYTSLLLAALESPAAPAGLQTVAVIGEADRALGPIAYVTTLFHLVERA